MKKIHFLTLALLSILMLLNACAGSDNSTGGGNAGGGATNGVALQGAGATFPYPLYSKWFSEYNKLNPTIKIDYQSIGSGGGIKQITEQTVDFGASDAPMNEEQLKALKKQPILHIPTVLGAVTVTYNLADIKGELKLTPEVVAGIFLGDIKKWNDAKIKESNPSLNLPDKDIAVVHRSDGSGTTAVFADYLSKVSKTWLDKVGRGSSVNWPVGIGQKGNEGVTNQIKQTDGAIGYVELVYALQNKMTYASLKNKAGKFVTPNLEAVTAAAAGTLAQMPADFRTSITDAEGDAAYPIASYTYLLVYQETDNKAKGEALVKFIWWALHEGQPIAKDLAYAPLPAELVKKIEEKVKAIKAGGAVVTLS